MQPIGLDNIGWKYYIVYVVILVIESCIAYGWFVETKGKALEEIAVIFDGDKADVRHAAATELKQGASVEYVQEAQERKL